MTKITKNTYLNFFKNYDLDASNKLIECIFTFSNDRIIITDWDFNIIITNSDNFKMGKNIFEYFSFPKFQNKTIQKYFFVKLQIKEEEFLYEVNISKIKVKTSNFKGYIFILKDITQKIQKTSLIDSLVDFMRDDLKTPLISQILALKIVLKEDLKEETSNLLMEILNSSESTYRMLKNRLQEIQLDNNYLILAKKTISIKTLTAKIVAECFNFLNSRKNIITINHPICKNYRIDIDEKFFISAIVNILYHINERCCENSTIKLDVDLRRNKIIFKITSNCKNFDKSLFEKSELSTKKYERLGYNNGLYLSEKIIQSHKGSISIKKSYKNKSVVSIEIPN